MTMTFTAPRPHALRIQRRRDPAGRNALFAAGGTSLSRGR